MNDDVFKAYCDKRCIPEELRSSLKNVIHKSWDYSSYELSIALGELKQVLIDALPKWLKKVYKGLSGYR